MYKIICNLKGSRSMEISDTHLNTISRYALLSDLLDSNGLVDDNVLDKLRLNVRSLLEVHHDDNDLLDLCQDVIFHDNMKSFGLHQLILLFIDWAKNQEEEPTESSEKE